MSANQHATSATRKTLVQATQDQHDALHRDPVLARLAARDVTHGEYITALLVIFDFFQGVETARQRLRCSPQFSLQPECKALSADLGYPLRTTFEPHPASNTEMLGWLYVAHGAAFGRAILRRNIETVLPHAPVRFLSLRAPLTTWKALLSELEEAGHCILRQLDIKHGAQAGFAAAADLFRQAGKTP